MSLVTLITRDEVEIELSAPQKAVLVEASSTIFRVLECGEGDVRLPLPAVSSDTLLELLATLWENPSNERCVRRVRCGVWVAVVMTLRAARCGKTWMVRV